MLTHPKGSDHPVILFLYEVRYKYILLIFLSNILGHRPPMSQDDLQMVINQTFTQHELQDFKETHQNVLDKFVLTN